MTKKKQTTEALIRFRTSKQFFNTISEDVGKYELKNEVSGPYSKAVISQHISEIDFYRCFLYLKNSLAKTVRADEGDNSLTAVNIEYMATIMSKPMEYSMPAKSKNKIQQSLAEELNRTPKSAYSAINRLRKAGYLVYTEDNLISPNRELQTLRKVTKDHLEKMGTFPVSYMLNFIVK